MKPAPHVLDDAREANRVATAWLVIFALRLTKSGDSTVELFGRDREATALKQTLESVLSAETSVLSVLIEGEAGVGKTALLSAVIENARLVDFRILQCTGIDFGAAAGFTGLHELLYPILPMMDALPPRQRDALRSVFAVDEGLSPDPFVVAIAALGLIEEAAAVQPVFLAVEDAPWLDVATARVLAFIAPRLRGSRALLVATARSAPIKIGLPTADQMRSLRLASTVVPLGPIFDRDAELLLDSLDLSLSAAERRRALVAAAGNPLALEEFAAAAEVPVGDTNGNRTLNETLLVSSRLEAVFLATLNEMSDRGQKVLLVAASAPDIKFSDILAASSLLGCSLADLDETEKVNILHVSSGRVCFRHPLLRSVVLNASSLAERLEAHKALGATLQSDVGAWHRASASLNRDEAVAVELDVVADRAANRGARPDAAVMLRRAAILSPDGAKEVGRLLRSADFFRQAGLTHAASATLKEAAVLVTEPMARARLFILQQLVDLPADGLSADHQLGGALTLAAELAGPHGTANAAERRMVLTAAAFAAGPYRTQPVTRQRIREGIEALGLSQHPTAMLSIAVVDPMARPEIRLALPGMMSALGVDPYASMALGYAADHQHDHVIAQAGFSSASARFHAMQSPADEATALAGLATSRMYRGQLDQAHADAEKAISISADLSLDPVGAAGQAVSALIHTWSGCGPAAQRAIQATRFLSKNDLAAARAKADWAAGLLALLDGRYRDALKDLEAAQLWSSLEPLVVADLAEAAAGCGEPALAQEAVRRAAHIADTFNAPHLRMLAHRGRALLTPGIGAAQHFEAALEAGTNCQMPLELARTHLLYGEWLRRDRRIVDARPHLTAARHVFAASGARAFSDRAAAELRAAGDSTWTDREPGSRAFDLTAQESQVVRLAAAGLSNKHIADQLYISRRTVDSHLYRAYPKLGIANRSQLHAALARTRSGVDEVSSQ